MIDHPNYRSSEEETWHIESTVDSGEEWRWTAIVTAISLVGNLIIFFVGRQQDWIPEEMPASTEAFSLVTVILMSTIPVLVFGALMVFLGNHAPRASRLFEIILLVVLILAVMGPVTLRDLEDPIQVTLVAMDIVTAGSLLLLTRIPEN